MARVYKVLSSRPAQSSDVKTCKRCSTTRPVAEFSKNSRYADGLWPYCKPCERARRAVYVAANLDHVKAINGASKDRTRDTSNARRRERRAADPNRSQLRKETYAKYRERELATQAAWKAANREQMRQQARERYWTDPDAARERQQTYRDANVGKARAWRRGRQAQQLNATPAWSDPRAIAALYDVAARVSACTGIPHEVDHVVPLRGMISRRHIVSGLHVEYNLGVVSQAANRRKSNIAWPHMPAREN